MSKKQKLDPRSESVMMKMKRITNNITKKYKYHNIYILYDASLPHSYLSNPTGSSRAKAFAHLLPKIYFVYFGVVRRGHPSHTTNQPLFDGLYKTLKQTYKTLKLNPSASHQDIKAAKAAYRHAKTRKRPRHKQQQQQQRRRRR